MAQEPKEIIIPQVEGQQTPPDEGSGPPIHALSAAALLAIDNLWNLAEWAVVDWIITIPLSFLTVSISTFLVQKKLKGDSTLRAMMFAFLLGVVAAVPTSLTGTPVGLGLLAWSGLGKWFGKHPPK